MVIMTVRLGDNYWLWLAPILLGLALVTWLLLTLRAARRRVPHPEKLPGGSPHRGPIQGGTFEGDPGQRNPGEGSYDDRSAERP
ncbi:hypothetical protein SAMN04489712_118110 [Thermomonospora echinospora]|uniref:Uncharacterized protein n=1 Tax=Thermomonospora echinospora TaxID=1992 RepID=A0A1H6DLB3_9ACTN|nr:hypothetical protein [Thermomonospora echinospora]SEG85931.1 hypothetical protein SAMN04489712_118110 [Thermomonospora echinospora]